MPVTTSPEVLSVLDTLRPVTTMEDLQVLLKRVNPVADQLVTNVMTLGQAFETTATELKDLFHQMILNWDRMRSVGYTEAHRQQFVDTVVALFTVQAVFEKSLRLGEFRARTVDEVVDASRPWRDKLRVKANHAFFFLPNRAAAYQDHNETGTVDEEVSDLRRLVEAAKADAAQLAAVGFTAEDIAEGERLEAEAEGRNLQAVVGIRNQADTKRQRDRLLTLAVLLARHARATGVSALWDDPEGRKGFERASFRNAMRRIRRRRGGDVVEVEEDVVAETPEVPSA